MKELKEMIKNYTPTNEQEENDQKLILKYIDTFEDCLTRKNEMCHFTASCWIVNKERNKVLMIYHNIYKSWAWVGGHADGDADLRNVAFKEAFEETGLETLKLLQEEPLGIEILTVDPHIKRNKFVSSHLHLDVCFLFEADEKEKIRIKEDENSDIGWINFTDIDEKVKEEKMKPIYKKLITKVLKMKN